MPPPRLLVAEGAVGGAHPDDGAYLIGAATDDAVLVLGTAPLSPRKDAAGADAADASKPPPFTFSLGDMLPHGLAVVGRVGAGAAAAPPDAGASKQLWVTLDRETGEFAVGGSKVPMAQVPPPSALAAGARQQHQHQQQASAAGLLPPNDAFVAVRATMPVMRVDALEELLLEEGGGGQLLFAAEAGGAGGGGIVIAPVAGAAATAATTPLAASAVAGATFVPLVDTSDSAAAPAAAPVFEYTPAEEEEAGGERPPRPLSHGACLLLLDAVAVVPAASPAARLARDHLAPALRAQLRLAKRVLSAVAAADGAGADDADNRINNSSSSSSSSSSSKQVVAARALHFLPPGLGFPVTLAYPAGGGGASEASLAPVRRAAHLALGLPTDRPLLRAANALDLGAGGLGGGAGGGGAGAAGGGAGGGAPAPATTTTKKLINVHEAIPAPPPLSGPTVTTAMVQGDYEYCHYLQDRVQDAGWGCAYRSLQTLLSWFRLQGFSAAATAATSATKTHHSQAPHLEAQRTLVRLGDKPTSFAGSNQWIGAIELGYVLDDWLGVQCRVLTAPRGEEVPALARQLAAHFEEHGTPVMVGGGVLAYTLLGVQFDDATGDAAFLILDPHYTGGDSREDLKGKIVGGGWVGWKRLGDRAAAGGELFARGAFYNFLCPMRPREV